MAHMAARVPAWLASHETRRPKTQPPRARPHGWAGALVFLALTPASALGTSGPRFSTYRAGRTAPNAWFVHRALRIAEGLSRAHRLNLMTPLSTRDEIAKALQDGDEGWAFRMLIQGRDHLQLSLSNQAADAWWAEPSSTGSAQWDALLAAIVRNEFETANLAAPKWTDTGPLRSEWLWESPFADPATVRRETPDYLARLGIFIRARDLETC